MHLCYVMLWYHSFNLPVSQNMVWCLGKADFKYLPLGSLRMHSWDIICVPYSSHKFVENYRVCELILIKEFGVMKFEIFCLTLKLCGLKQPVGTDFIECNFHTKESQ